MIEVPQGVDRGRALFEKFPKVITNFVVDRKHTYFDSKKVYKPLVDRVKLIDNLVDNVYDTKDTFVSDVAMPIVRKRWRELNAFIRKYFENDPLVTFTAIGDTPVENAKNRQSIVARNFISTRFRELAFRPLIDSAARYGAYCAFTQYVEKTGPYGGYRSVYDPDAHNPYQIIQNNITQRNALTYPVHILNYFCDPQRTPFSKGEYEGFIDTWRLSQLATIVNSELYIKENVVEILEKRKKGGNDALWYGGNGEAELKDYSRAIVHPSRMFTTLPFEGNEDDPTDYYIEFIDNKIIRINESILNEHERPITTGTLLNRTNVWWGNSDIEDVIPQQNVSNWLFNSSIENTMRAMDNFILTPRGALNIADINNRHQQGGVVFYDGMMPPDKLMYQVQKRDNSLQNLDWINREIKQSIQESSPIVNMQNKYNEGGLNNSTLGAAQMVASIGETLQADMMTNFAYGIVSIGRVSGNILEIMLPEEIDVPTPQGRMQLEKYQMMGEFETKDESSMTINDVVDFTKNVNILTQFLNWKGTGLPEFNGVNIAQMIKDVIKAGKGWYSNLDSYYNEEQAIPQQMLIGAPGGQLPPQEPQMAQQPQEMGMQL